MNKKIIAYIIIGVIVFLLILSSFGMIKFNKTASDNNGDMPEKCKPAPGYTEESWKEHMGHHPDIYKECLQ